MGTAANSTNNEAIEQARRDVEDAQRRLSEAQGGTAAAPRTDDTTAQGKAPATGTEQVAQSAPAPGAIPAVPRER